MCGICGAISNKGEGVDEEELRSMLPALANRGPDNEDIRVDKNYGFGHRRLKIIDLSEQGNQPMIDPELGLVITYNGMIYNYKELKKELEHKGYRFRSNSDTEVMLKAYHCWGDLFVQKLYGMFAFCLHDRKKNRFVMGRDRLGIKPLYYTEKNGNFYFASNMQSLNDAGVVDRTLSREALHYYLSFHAVVPAPHTIYKSVQKLEPGYVMVLEPGGTKKLKRYWSVDYQHRLDMSEEEWMEAILLTLKESVKRRMVSDVPVGALLSGGLDSSLIVALMAELDTSQLRTYSIGFEDVDGEDGNEFQYSDIIAEKYNTQHSKFFIDSNKLLPQVKRCLEAMAEPMVSHDAVGFHLLSEEVTKDTKVVLCGQGADEIFAGYHWYPQIMEGSEDPVTLYRQSFFDRGHQEILDTLSQEYHPSRDYSIDFVRDHFSKPGADTPVDKALRLDSTVMLVEDPVKRVDNMTMDWGLEARVPFLDHDVVELAAQIPPSLKVSSGGKHILKRAAERILPREVIYRKKGYFPVPALKYLQGEFLEFARDMLLSHRARQRNIFQQHYLESLLERPQDQMTVLGGNKVWQMAVLEYWLQKMEG